MDTPAMTPMLKQYMDIKKNHKDDILLFRLGDLYEMFFEDAFEASKILDIVLTSRQANVPMCGIPYHAVDSYVARLIKAGKRVAVCEQMEDPASTDKLVAREVVRIITPGTLVDADLLQTDDNNFLAAAVLTKKRMGLAFVDVSTGDFFLSSMERSPELFRIEINRFEPAEIVINEEEKEDPEFTDYLKEKNIAVYRISQWLYDPDYMLKLVEETYGTAGVKGLGLSDETDVVTAGAVIQYLRDTQKCAVDHLKAPKRMISSDCMILDEATVSSLELTVNHQDGSRDRTLFSLLNRTCTPMGRRTLERNLLQPLLSVPEIEKRLDFVELIKNDSDLADSLHRSLKGISDMERIVSRFNLGKIITRNFTALAESIRLSMEIKNYLSISGRSPAVEMSAAIPDCTDLCKRIESAVADEPAVTPEQGRVIRPGFSHELDHLYSLKTDAKEWMLNYQEKQKERLGASSLKVRYNKIVGYYIEISKVQAEKAPDDYRIKQTLVSSTRFTTEELQKFETDILSASERIIALENRFIKELADDITGSRETVQKTAELIGTLDFYCSLALAAEENNFTRPSFNEEGITEVLDARHPVVEKYYTNEVFIPNDLLLDKKDNIIQIITGPNMAGKSTYIRMSGIIQLMAQTGSFIPAKSGKFSIVDRIFTRIGSSDNISRGESTFLVEMNETANIINNATENSLIIMDEVGRGTSTYDGLSIAWSVIEYIQKNIKARTLFATHYHELTALGKKNGIVNYNVLVKENMRGVDFLHKVVPGAAGKSYGIHVARLAGLPVSVISRASGILEKLEKNGTKNRDSFDEGNLSSSAQLDIFNASNNIVIQAIEKIDCNSITPLEALNELNRLKKLIK